MKLPILLLLCLLPTATLANPEFKGDPKQGKPLAEKSCVACHVKMYGGDGSKIYTREERKIKSLDALRQRVAVCNANTNSGWFPEEEEHVAAWLNQQYYKLK